MLSTAEKIEEGQLSGLGWSGTGPLERKGAAATLLRSFQEAYVDLVPPW